MASQTKIFNVKDASLYQELIRVHGIGRSTANNICKHFNIDNKLDISYTKNIQTLYKKSINDTIKSKADMYESIKDNSVLKDIEDVFEAKVDKDNISKL